MDDEKCLDMASRISAVEADVRNMQEGNKIFRDEIRSEVRELRKQNEAIYEIAASVKVMAQDMQSLKDDLKEVKVGQQELGNKMDSDMQKVRKEQSDLRNEVTNVESTVDTKDAKKIYGIWTKVRDNAIWLFVGAIVAFLIYTAWPFLQK